MQKKYTIAAAILLAFAVIISYASQLNDSATMDEKAHIPSGYSYLKYGDYRLNPEHPPLAKDLAELPVVFLSDIKFPTDDRLWTEYRSVYGDAQWDAGDKFIYGIGNDADKIVYWSHFGPLLIFLVLGWFLFKAVSEWFSNRAGLLALFFYTLSPTILGHNHLVTTDVAAACGIFIAIYYYVRYLKNPGTKSLLYAGIAFGICFLLKFSAFLIIPLFGLLGIIKMIQMWSQGAWKSIKTYILGTVLIGIVGLLVIFPIYYHHTYNYPPERQRADANFILQTYANGPDPEWKTCSISYKQPDINAPKRTRCIAELTIWLSDKPVARAWAQYFLGMLMVIQRASAGNTTFFLGEVSNTGWHYYFPVVYLLKEPLSFLALMLVSMIFVVLKLFGKKKPADAALPETKTSLWTKLGDKYLPEVAMITFLAIYWASSVSSQLNIGVRHLMPTFPLAYALVASQIDKLLTWASAKNLKKAAYAVLGLLLAFQAFSTIRVFPHFLSYFNESVGTENGYKYAVDSNFDWGQDLKRAVKFVEDNNIKKIMVDYFGAASPKYYLGDKLVYRGDQSAEWLAISTTFLQGQCGKMVKWFSDESVDALQKRAKELNITVSDDVLRELTDYSGFDKNRAKEFMENLAKESAANGSNEITMTQATDHLRKNTYYNLCTRTPDAKAGYSIFLFKMPI